MNSTFREQNQFYKDPGNPKTTPEGLAWRDRDSPKETKEPRIVMSSLQRVTEYGLC